MKKSVRGSFTIEAAVIIPLILLVFVVSLNGLFYYHDRSVLAAAAYETVAVGSGRTEWEEEKLDTYFQNRIKGRTLLFSNVESEVKITEKQVKIFCYAGKNGLSISVKRVMQRTEPENYIRNLRKIGKIQENIGETE